MIPKSPHLVVRRFDHIKDVAAYIPKYRPECPIGLLVGRDLPEAHHVHQQVTGPRGSPFAQRTGLGWVVVGEVCLRKVHSPDGLDRVNVLKTNVVNGHGSIFTPCKFNLSLKKKDDEKPAWSVEDSEFIELMNQECSQDESDFGQLPCLFVDLRHECQTTKPWLGSGQ